MGQRNRRGNLLVNIAELNNVYNKHILWKNREKELGSQQLKKKWDWLLYSIWVAKDIVKDVTIIC